jgi:pimeloyl-ACP methyl ester carboxylesterase
VIHGRSRRAGRVLNHRRAGSGEPLLLLHSLGGSIVQWSPLWDRLAAEREVIAVDMPGFGASPPLPAGIEPSAANLASAVLDFSESLALDEPHVAGISLGGWVAIECGRRGRARSVVGICTAGFWREPLEPRRSTTHAAARLLRPLVPLLLRSGSVRARALRGNLRHPERVPAGEAIALVRGYGGAPAYPEASRLMRAGLVGDLDGLRTPLTLAWAEFDTLVRNRPLRKGILPGRVRQVTLEDCGHLPTWDDPEQVARVILEGTGASPPP